MLEKRLRVRHFSPPVQLFLLFPPACLSSSSHFLLVLPSCPSSLVFLSTLFPFLSVFWSSPSVSPPPPFSLGEKQLPSEDHFTSLTQLFLTVGRKKIKLKTIAMRILLPSCRCNFLLPGLEGMACRPTAWGMVNCIGLNGA